MREKFWNELNETRASNDWRLWENVFPEAAILDMNCLIETNQYLSISGGKNAFQNGQPMVGPVHHDIRCLLYTSPSPRDAHESRMPSSA